MVARGNLMAGVQQNNGMPRNSCATSSERSSAIVHRVCCSRDVLYAQQACPVGCVGDQR